VAYKRLSLTRGNDENYELTFYKSDGTPYCIKNWVVRFTLKTNYNLSDAEASLQKTVSTFSDTTSGTSGVANIPLVRADTISLDPGEYDFDITATTNESKIYTVLKGKFDLEWNVTSTPGTAGTAA
jgi:hypothetical protein